MELQPRMQGINHAHGKSSIPEGKMVILCMVYKFHKYSFITNQISQMNRENLQSLAFGENKETVKARDIAVRYTYLINRKENVQIMYK